MTEKRKPGRPKGSGTKKKGSPEPVTPRVGSRLLDEIWSIILIALGIFLILAMHTSAAGAVGLAASKLLKGCFGWTAFLLAYYLIVYGILLFLGRMAHVSGRSLLFLVLIYLSLTILNSYRFLDPEQSDAFRPSFLLDLYQQGTTLESGGAVGMILAILLEKSIGMTGLIIFCTVLIVVSFLLIVNTPVSQFFDRWKEKRAAKRAMRDELLAAEALEAKVSPAEPKEPIDSKIQKTAKQQESRSNTPTYRNSAADGELPSFLNTDQSPELISKGHISPNQMKIMDYMNDNDLFGDKDSSRGKEDPIQEEASPAKEVHRQRKSNAIASPDLPDLVIPDHTSEIAFRLPSIELLNKAAADSRAGENENLKSRAEKLEETLQNFGVNARVVQVTRGPAVTRYEIQPNTGVKVSSIVRLQDDIALNLEAKSIRIEAPIPGKAAVGIEVENERIHVVSVREMIESKEFQSAKSKITFVVGKDIAGKAIVANLKDMPHLLIAGSTGSGKSVCINTLITSILYRAKPDEVKLVLIDPKVVELNNYNGIPHLLIPVVTDPSKASAALGWAVAEMTNRYRKFAELGVRDLESFNEKTRAENPSGVLPQIVIIIDELADLMMTAPAQVEESISRLAQMARAAGMHLIVATQRPSVDVITGVIKANIPSRIAFAVSSQFDSRTILDMGGAERLVGKGDMLFNPIGLSKPIRVQGAFISDGEVHKVIDFWKEQSPETAYASDVLHSIERGRQDPAEEFADDLLKDAIETVVHAEQASVSMLQRRFRIGYNRAARLIDMMEDRGIIGASDGSRPRKVLISREELDEMETQATHEQ